MAGSKLDTQRLHEISARVKAEADQLEREIFGMCGRGVHPRLAQAARGGPVRQARPVAQAAGQDRILTDARVLQAIRHEHPVIPKIERWRELTKLAQTYLDALPAAHGLGWPHSHHLQPDRRDHRPPLLKQPEPPEHPDPHAARSRDPGLLRGRARQPAGLGRLFPG